MFQQTVLDQGAPYPSLPEDWSPHSLWDQLSPTLDPHLREAVDRFHRARTVDTQLLQTVQLAQVPPSTHPEAETAVILAPRLMDPQDTQPFQVLEGVPLRPHHSHRKPKVKKAKVNRFKYWKARLSLYLYENWGIKW